MLELEMVRHNHQIDPHLQIWGWQIPLYLFLGGLAAGVMILVPLLRLQVGEERLSRWARWLPATAPVAISIGMLALFLDLANREQVYRFYLAFRPLSPMSWGAWVLIGIYPATLLLTLLGLRPHEVAALEAFGPLRVLRSVVGFAKSHEHLIVWSNIVLGIALGAYTGLLLGTLAARPAWNSVLLGPLFLASGLSTGAALMMLFPIHKQEHHRLRNWDVVAIVVEMLLLALFLLSLAASGGQAGAEAAWLFVGGRFTTALWALVVLAGLVVPLVLELIEARQGRRPTVVTAILVLIGGLSLRWVVVLAGQA